MLYLVPTPIGNLGDITLRALDVLRECHTVVCEDTRRTGQLLKHFDIKKPLKSFHDHSREGALRNVLALLEEGRDVVYVTDAGTPLVSDPGYPLVHAAVSRQIKIEALPGPCAAVTALSASGLPADRFGFYGFLSPKPGARRKQMKALSDREETLVFYESPYRLIKTLTDAREVLGDREAVVAREMTKIFEEFVRGKLSYLIDYFSQKAVKGEIVLLITGKTKKKYFE